MLASRKDNLFCEELKFSSQIYSALFQTKDGSFRSKRILPFKSSLQYFLFLVWKKEEHKSRPFWNDGNKRESLSILLFDSVSFCLEIKFLFNEKSAGRK